MKRGRTDMDFTTIREDIYRFSSYWTDELEDPSNYDLSLGHFDRLESHQTPEPSDWILPSLLSGSDYSGGSVTVSNHRVFLERFENDEGGEPNPGIRRVWGGYGTYGVAIRLDSITEEIQEVLDRLENYCVMDEDLMSEVERKAENEAWDSWVKGDLVSALDKLGIEIDRDDERLPELFYEAMERENVYWENEEGNTAHVDVDRVAKSIAENWVYDDPDPDVIARVQNGLEVLNDYFGSPKVWVPLIELESLNMEDCSYCVLGQVFDDDEQLGLSPNRYMSGFAVGLIRLGLLNDGQHYEDCGFGGGRELTQVWKSIITELEEGWAA
jgi:hypothetical protein